MAFRRIRIEDLKSKTEENFIGMPLKLKNKVGFVGKTFTTGEITNQDIGKYSEILITNEEVLEFQYNYKMERKSLLGYGNITISNNSNKDRIWDALLKFSGAETVKIESDNNMNLGVIEPKSNKTIKFDFINTDELPEMLKVEENIEIVNNKMFEFNDVINELEISGDENIYDRDGREQNLLLLLEKENKIKFIITLENISQFICENVKLDKILSQGFYDFDFKSAIHKNIRIIKKKINWSINKILPGERVELVVFAKIVPKRKERIKSGIIELNYSLKGYQLSGIKIEDFSAYSHAMHTIKVAEKDTEPNLWQCSLIFENLSDFGLNLKSLHIKDKSKLDILDINFENERNLVLPGEKYTTKDWEIKDANEPKFSRKTEYSVDFVVKNDSTISAIIEDTYFKIAGFQIDKKLSKTELKSFEEASLETEIIIKNMSNVPIKGLIIKDTIPENFLPSTDVSNYNFRSSAGDLKIENFNLKITPSDEDPSKTHLLELELNLGENNLKHLITGNDLLKLNYSINAINPDYRKNYEFPIEVNAYYNKFESPKSVQNDFYVLKEQISQKEGSSIKITHKRRKLTIGKSILPGRNSDEFAINILVKNKSNAELNSIDISDTFPNSFQFVSSNLKHNLNNSGTENNTTISFSLDQLLPYQEKEIMYYLKKDGSRDIEYSELESVLYG